MASSCMAPSAVSLSAACGKGREGGERGVRPVGRAATGHRQMGGQSERRRKSERGESVPGGGWAAGAAAVAAAGGPAD